MFNQKPSLHSIKATGAKQPPLFELRSYKTRPGKREKLISLFEANFLDAYELAGATILGSFCNLDDPDRWVWIRAFASAEARGTALEGFYSSPTWHELRAAANATIASSSDARLLRSAAPGRPSISISVPFARHGTRVIECTRYFHKSAQSARELRHLLQEMNANFLAVGGQPIGTLETDSAPNHYPRQSLRRERTFVSMVRFENTQIHAASLADRAADQKWQALKMAIEPHLVKPIETWRLKPTSRSAL